MQIDISARKETQRWFNGQPMGSSIDLAVCPRDVNPDTKTAQLADSKAEFYGRIGRLMKQGYDRSVSLRPERGDIGFVNWVHEPILSQDIANWDEFEHAFYKTLSVDLRDCIRDIQSFANPNEAEAQAQFEEYLALYALLRHRVGLKQYGFADTWLTLQAGVGTATSHIVKLAPKVYETSQRDIALTRKSHKPLLRLASMSIDQLMYFDDAYLGNPNADDFLTTTSRGTVDFTKQCIEDIDAQTNNHQPTIGCPVLLTRDATKYLWQWGITAAQKCNLFTDVPCQ